MILRENGTWSQSSNGTVAMSGYNSHHSVITTNIIMFRV